MADQFERTQLILGSQAMDRLKSSRVIVFGVGGVGGYVTEALVRSGVGSIDIVDADTVALSNLNRQIIALHSTVGRDKVEVMKERILDINPECKVTAHKVFFLPETAGLFDFKNYDYVVDCIDTVKGKIQIIEMAKAAGVPVISSMGAGNKKDPAQFKIADISKTSVCPLARVIRQELKKRSIKDVKCVYSTEEAVKTGSSAPGNGSGDGSKIIGSTAFVPSVCGLLIASQVIDDLCRSGQ